MAGASLQMVHTGSVFAGACCLSHNVVGARLYKLSRSKLLESAARVRSCGAEEGNTVGTEGCF